ncbi:hypothetical protein GGQ71_004379 [Rhizobium taibaishanense]|uniref:Uncharacterized protein n=1 Tax=Allorhizobium taibaishanense TaxID=887144 RepID=A0A7W6MW86_9HYPH|nr:hypothetical protein [Allorhizobium taibaishanense]
MRWHCDICESYGNSRFGNDAEIMPQCTCPTLPMASMRSTGVSGIDDDLIQRDLAVWRRQTNLLGRDVWT